MSASSSFPPAAPAMAATPPTPDMSALFQSARKYEELDVIGTGAYGTVYAARDLANGGQLVALKKVKVALTEDGIPLSTLREIALLRQLEAYRHPNIVRLLDVCHGGGAGGAGQLLLWLVFEHVEQDLEVYLKRHHPLPPATAREMARDMLSGVEFLHSHRIVHRDLKPHNLLVSGAGRLKIADFGLAKTYDAGMRLTGVVVTLWYRAPEVLLGAPYASGVDVWAAGLVLAQLLRGRALLAADGERAQLAAVLRLTGRPPRAQWPARAPLAWSALPPQPPADLGALLPRAPPAALALLAAMLAFDPRLRPSARDCLAHPYFADSAA